MKSKKISLLSVTKKIPKGREKYGIEEISELIFKLKKVAKGQDDDIAAAILTL